ncbi:MAG: hypothetical protein ACYC1E_09285 [Propionibacteriaceae bacterium]
MTETPQASGSSVLPRTPSALPRRVVVGVVLAPIAFWALVTAAGGLAGASVEWVVLVALASAFGAAGLATYVPGPGAGRTPVWGCAPCAAAAAASLPLAALMLHLNPLQISSAGMSALVTGLGLVQRLRDPKACPTRPTA